MSPSLGIGSGGLDSGRLGFESRKVFFLGFNLCLRLSAIISSHVCNCNCSDIDKVSSIEPSSALPPFCSHGFFLGIFPCVRPRRSNPLEYRFAAGLPCPPAFDDCGCRWGGGENLPPGPMSGGGTGGVVGGMGLESFRDLLLGFHISSLLRSLSRCSLIALSTSYLSRRSHICRCSSGDISFSFRRG